MTYVKCVNVSKIYQLKNLNQAKHFKNNILGGDRIHDNRFVALHDLSFELNEGDRLGVIGMNGAGKSTLLKIISGVLKPTKGKVEILGSVNSVIEQSSLFVPDISGIENIYMLGTLTGYDNEFIETRLPAIIEYSGLGNYIYEPVRNYSSGMITRLSFAMFNELSPDILILDEALGAGDSFFLDNVEKSLVNIFDKSKIVIIASHQMQEIYKYCNKCLVLNNGHLEFAGTVADAASYYLSLNRMFEGYTKENRFLKLQKVELNSKTNSYKTSEKIVIKIGISKLTADNEVYPAIYVSNHLGNILTDCPRYRKDYKQKEQISGEYLFTVEIPANLLNAGEYSVTIILGNINEVLLEIKDVIKFKVTPDDWELEENWNIPTYFPIKPQLEWEIIKI